MINKIEKNLINLFFGKLPLYKSYWWYYVFGNFLISIPLLLISKKTIENFVYTFSIYLFINLSFYLITCIGVWKSALNYKKNIFLSFLARLVVVLGISTTIIELKRIVEIFY